MRILFIGDVVGKPGMRLLSNLVPEYIENNIYDLICVNGENSAGGFGITKNGALKLKRYGCDVITTGNHIIDRKQEIEEVFKLDNVLRPLNYDIEFAGNGWTLIEKNGKKIAIVNLQGQVFMPDNPKTRNPFKVINDELENIIKITPVIIVDFHAETTAEKIAMRYHLDGKVSAIIGTHTHVQTADERITPGKTAYISDVGMTGPFDSIIGMQPGPILEKFMGAENRQFKLAKKDIRMNAVEIDINEENGHAREIRRLEIEEDS